MPTPEYYTGDTHPPLSGTVKDASGAAVDLSTADSLRMIAKSSAVVDPIAGTAIADPDQIANKGKWTYTWAADDLASPGSYCPEIEVTWDSASTPPKIETFRDDAVTFLVKADND